MTQMAFQDSKHVDTSPRDNGTGYPLPHANWLATFVDGYQALGTHNLETLREIYHPAVVFQDPLHKLSGLEELESYFDGLYRNLSSCRFEIEDVIEQPEQAFIYWKMRYVHPKLNGGNAVTVEGHSHIKCRQDKVVFHRDYLDAGAMLYEQIPLLGSLVRLVKNRATQ